ncbi:carbohydrate ABC transporter permease [Atopococcus tabaci]|uniref:carbohydrate ABC transporter permease n=1 Tax=Atopococcus tabaci TaxID=269774 RepID=UPI00041FAFF2|nr:sugar ABC transporter permease [Atopococcus tabaci]
MSDYSLDDKRKVGEKQQRKKNKYQSSLKKAFWLFVLPSGLLFGVFFLYPLALNMFLSFTNFDGWKTMDFIGIDNYTRALNDRDFYASFTRTMVYTLVNLPFKVGIPLVLATLLTSKRVRFKTLTRTAIYIPVLLSPLVAGITINWMFSQEYGLINFLIQLFGGTAIGWASSKWLATFVISVASNWMTAGFYMIIYIGAINNIPETIYEAAEIDGVNSIQKFLRIQVPLLAPTTFLVTLLSTINLLKEFALVEGVTQGGPGTSTTFIIQYIMRQGFNQFEYGYAAAVSTLVMIVFAIVAYIQFRITRGGEI